MSVKTRVRDIEVSYAAAHEGPPVVLVHGLGQDHRSWAPQLLNLKGCRIYAFDVRGHGETSLGNADGTLEQLGDDLIGFLEQVGPAHCVGFSMGGTIVAWAATARPDLVKSAILLGTSSAVNKTAADFYRQRIELMRSGDRSAIEQAMLSDLTAFVKRPANLQQMNVERMQVIGDGSGYCNGSAAMAGLNERPLTPALARITTPTLVVSGENDIFCPRKAAEIMLRQIPHGAYQELKGVGHLMNVDDPDAVTAVIQNYLDQQPQRS